jgi:hypothetical protein
MKSQGLTYGLYSEAREPAKLSHLGVFSGSYAQHIARPMHSRDLLVVSKTGLRPDGTGLCLTVAFMTSSSLWEMS